MSPMLANWMNWKLLSAQKKQGMAVFILQRRVMVYLVSHSLDRYKAQRCQPISQY